MARLFERAADIVLSTVQAVIPFGSQPDHQAGPGMLNSLWMALGMAVQRELASQLGITPNAIEWLVHAYAVKLRPSLRAMFEKGPCTGCPA